jgi:Flp pilus assembly protein TadD
MSRPASSPLRGTLAPALLVALALGGCNNPLPSVSDPIASRPPPPQSDQVALRAYAEQLEPKYAQNADDRVTALHYAQALRGLGQHAQAVAVLQGLAVKNPHDKALADAGRLQEAQSVLERAHTPDRPSWSVLSAQGSVADQMGDHAGAQHYYSAALKIVPNQPDVLSNLGLSYALERKMPQAEQALRLAADQPSADSRVRQNLALVLSLEGKYADAEQVSRRDMTPIDAAENVAQLKQTIAGSPTWSQAEAARPGPRRIVRQTADAPVRTASSDSDQ